MSTVSHPPPSLPETRSQQIQRLTATLSKTQAHPESCVGSLRNYHSEPALVTPKDPEFQRAENQRKHGPGYAKTMEDAILTGLSYPSLITEPIFQPGDKNRTYFINEKVRQDWEAVAVQESNRFSFYDALFAGGYVVDSLEVPSRLGDISYLVEGDVSSDAPLDYGRMVFKTKTVFTGNLNLGHFSGPGRYIWLDGTIYQGDFLDGLMHGEGVLLLPDGCFFEGEFNNGERTGWGVYTTQSGLMYAGDWLKGLPQGQGKVWYNPDVDDGDYYDGEWNRGIIHGFGTRQYSNGDRYIGNFKNGIRKGQGTMIWLNERQVYKGEWEDGQPHGFGEHIWYIQRSPTCPYPQRNIYKGDFANGQRHGIGRMIYACGSIYDGKWHDGVKHGKGIFVNPAGEVLFAIFRQGAISGGADVPLHVPTYACKFRPLIIVLQQRLHTSDPTLAETEEEYLSETVTRFLTRIRSLYKRAGYLGEWWGNQGQYPQWMKKHRSQGHHLQHRHTHDPILESIQSQIYETDSVLDEGWAHGHKPHFGSPDHINPVTRFGLWLLLKDCPGVLTDITLAELDAVWNTIPSISFQTRHHPFEPIQLWQFLQCLVVVSSMIYIEIPKRTYQYEANIKEDEDAFGSEDEAKTANAEHEAEEEEEADEALPSSFLKPPQLPDHDDHSSKTSVKKERKTSAKSHASDGGKDQRKHSAASSGSGKGLKSNKLKPPLAADPKMSSRRDVKGKRKHTPPPSVDIKIRIEATASTQTEGRYGIEKNSDEAQTEFEEGDEIVRDFLLSEAFELFLTDFLIPCLERRPGKYLPQAPNPLPSLADLYASFNIVSPYKDVISAREFLISTLRHRQAPTQGSSIYWTRSRNLMTPDIDMGQLFTHFRESDSPVQEELLDDDFLSEKLSNPDLLTEEIKAEVFGDEIETKEKRRNSSIKIFGSGNIVFGEENQFDPAGDGSGDFEVKSEEVPSETDLDLLPLGEDDLTSVPFLWAADPVCSQVTKNEKALDNVELSDVLKILRQFYPKACDHSNVNLEFHLTFGDWVWLTMIITKLSTDRAFCAWMKKESGVEHKPRGCQQLNHAPPPPRKLVIDDVPFTVNP